MDRTSGRVSPSQSLRLERHVRDACRRAASPARLFESFEEALSVYVPVDRWCAMTLDPGTALPTGGVHEHGLSLEGGQRLLALEFGGAEDANKLVQLARGKSAVGTLSGATRGRLENSPRFREVLSREGMAHELRAVFRDAGGPWAAMILFRHEGEPGFDASEVALLAALNGTLTRALRRLLLTAELDRRADVSAPGLVLLSANTVDPLVLDVKHMSASAMHWVGEIADTSAGPLPFALYSAALTAFCRGHSMVRIRTRGGHWLTAHAERVSPDGGDVSLILQASRPYEIAQVLAGAYGLTAREAEVARLVAAGHSNEEIAGLLFVSKFTIEDHLKNAYAKLGVRGRNELVSRLFFDEYLPRSARSTQLDADGWFMREVEVPR
jgi:DNA-binding CsgD family transcriptional regulator